MRCHAPACASPATPKPTSSRMDSCGTLRVPFLVEMLVATTTPSAGFSPRRASGTVTSATWVIIADATKPSRTKCPDLPPDFSRRHTSETTMSLCTALSMS